MDCLRNWWWQRYLYACESMRGSFGIALRLSIWLKQRPRGQTQHQKKRGDKPCNHNYNILY